MRIAVIGSGVAGLSAAHLLGSRHDVTLYEADGRPGGHANTVRVELGDESCDVDTGFLVFNERTYPGLVRLLGRLGVASHPSDMSFSVSDEASGLEWRGTSLSTVFAQRHNVRNPAFLRMLLDVARFNRLGRAYGSEAGRGRAGGTRAGGTRAAGTSAGNLELSLGEWLGGHQWSETFLRSYLRPLASAIWSADPAEVEAMPVRTTFRFFERHGLLSIGDQPSWRTVTGGARRYVDQIVDPLARAGRLRLGDPVQAVRRVAAGPGSENGTEIVVESASSSPQGERYDHVVIATHSDQALKCLEAPSLLEQEVLGAIRYQPNVATLHRDMSIMPSERRAWASWNYHCLADSRPKATLTYHLNRLQGLDATTDLMVTLNRDDAIAPEAVIARFDYAHPVLTPEAVRAQRRHGELIGHDGISYAGAYWGYGFHEDGVQSALRVGEHFGVTW
jgi:predicted NAD/FAD-binding protein